MNKNKINFWSTFSNTMNTKSSISRITLLKKSLIFAYMISQTSKCRLEWCWERLSLFFVLFTGKFWKKSLNYVRESWLFCWKPSLRYYLMQITRPNLNFSQINNQHYMTASGAISNLTNGKETYLSKILPQSITNKL